MLGSILFISINYFYPPTGLGLDVPFNETILKGVEDGTARDDGSDISMKEEAMTLNQLSEKIA